MAMVMEVPVPLVQQAHKERAPKQSYEPMPEVADTFARGSSSWSLTHQVLTVALHC